MSTGATTPAGPALRPVHRQFGSKWRVAPEILRLVPPGKRLWAEVFAGTASVTLRKPPHPEEHLNDLNGDIVSLFRVLRDDQQRARLIEQIALTPYAEDEWHWCRDAPPTDDPVERARRYLVLSWGGRGGKSGTRTGWKAVDKCNRPATALFRALPARLGTAAARLSTCIIHCQSAEVLLDRLGRYEDAVLFLDPPYPRGAVDSHGRLYQIDMTDAEHAALAELLLDVRAGVILTMAPGTVYDQVLADWHRTPLPVRGLRSQVKTEIIFTNFPPPADLFSLSGAA